METRYPPGYLSFRLDTDLDPGLWVARVKAECALGDAESEVELSGSPVRGILTGPAESSGRFEERVAGTPDRQMRVGPESRAATAGVGAALFRMAFQGEVKSLYERLRQRASDEGLGVRIELKLQPGSRLNSLPWELMEAPDTSRPAADLNSAVVRCPTATRQRPVEPGWWLRRLLLVAANPQSTTPLDLADEIAAIEEACRRNRVQLVRAKSSEPKALRQEIRDGDFDAIHFMGHAVLDGGLAVGRLILAGEDRRPLELDADAVARLFVARVPPRLVVLNACNSALTVPGAGAFSGLASALFQAGVPAVVGMQEPIRDDAAVVFGGALYELLAKGWPIEAAVSESRHLVSLSVPETSQWAVPVLFLPGSRADPAGAKELELAGAGSLRRRFDERFTGLHRALVRLRLLAEPPERRQLLDLARAQVSRWKQAEAEEVTYLPLRAERLPMADLPVENEVGEGDPFTRAIRRRIRRLLDPPAGREDPDSANSSAWHGHRVHDLDRILSQSRQPLVLLGDPGSGKTRTLRRMELAFLEAEETRIYPRVVVFVRLGEFHVRGKKPDVADVKDLVRRACPRELRSADRNPLHLSFDGLFEAGRLIVLFDGMDEMSREGYNDHTTALSTFGFELAQAGGRCIFTCRIEEFDPALRHERVVLLPFDRVQIKRYLAQRFRDRRALPIEGERWRLGRLARYLTGDPRSLQAGNPFSLFLLSGFLERRHVFPASRLEMFEDFFRSRYAKKAAEVESAGEPRLPAERDVFHAWARIAWLISAWNSGSAIELESLAEDAALAASLAAGEVVRAGTLCGLLEQVWEGKRNLIWFRHHQFQEYFAARWMHEEGATVDWLAKLDAPRWQETILNLVMLGGGEEGLAALAESLAGGLGRQREARAQWEERQQRPPSTDPAKGGPEPAPEGAEAVAAPPSALPPYPPEASLADRVVLGARLVQHGGTASSADRLLRPPLQEAIGFLIRHGRPVTQVKMLRACKALKDPSLAPAVVEAGRSPVVWVRDQAILLNPEQPTEIGIDLATSELLPRWTVFFRSVYSGAGAGSWLSLIAATVLGIVHLAALLGLSLALSWMCLRFLVEADTPRDAVPAVLGPAGKLWFSLFQVGFTLGVSLFALATRPRRVWIWCLGAAPVGCAIGYATLAVWQGNLEGVGLAEALLLLVLGLPVGAVVCALLHLAVLAAYSLAIPRQVCPLPFARLAATAWSACAYGGTIVGFFAFLLLGLVGGGAKWAAEGLGKGIGYLLALLGGWLYDGLSLLADRLQSRLGTRMELLAACGLLALGLLIPPVRRGLVRALRLLPGIAVPVGCLAVATAGLFLVVLMIDDAEEATDWLYRQAPFLQYLPQAALVVVLFFVVRGVFRKVVPLITSRPRVNPYPPGSLTPESWKTRLAAASPREQQVLLWANHSSLSLRLSDFRGLFQEVEELVKKEEPALSTYWQRLDEIEQALLQERIGPSDPHDPA